MVNLLSLSAEPPPFENGKVADIVASGVDQSVSIDEGERGEKHTLL